MRYADVFLSCDRDNVKFFAHVQFGSTHVRLWAKCTSCYRIIEREIEFRRVQQEAMMADGSTITFAGYQQQDVLVRL